MGRTVYRPDHFLQLRTSRAKCTTALLPSPLPIPTSLSDLLCSVIPTVRRRLHCHQYCGSVWPEPLASARVPLPSAFQTWVAGDFQSASLILQPPWWDPSHRLPLLILFTSCPLSSLSATHTISCRAHPHSPHSSRRAYVHSCSLGLPDLI